MAQIELDRGESTRVPRLASGIRELDRVLGISGDETDPEGISVGLVPGSAVLVAGEPGIGKSTLLLPAAAGWAALEGVRVLYASSEESAEQVSHRAARVLAHHDEDDPGAQAGAALTRENLFLMHDANLARILEQVRRVAPTVLVIDSVQMIYKGDVSAAPGSVTQLRRCCADLVYLAKAANIAVVLVGHVTKDGVIAGPRLLEHLVDTVVTFEGERAHTHRIVRSVKNRFGTTLEIGLFEMTGFGLREVPEGASVAALADKDTPRPGSVVCPVLTGTRCVLVEVQALTATGFLGAAKRKCSGLDANRLAMIIAVLEQHAGLRLADRDIFASSVGGLRIIEPAGDLALLLAIAGAHYRKALPARTIVAGEVGLGGEIRPVPHLEQRVREAARLGFVNMLVPASTESARLSKQARTLGWGESVALIPLKNVNDAIQQLGL